MSNHNFHIIRRVTDTARPSIILREREVAARTSAKNACAHGRHERDAASGFPVACGWPHELGHARKQVHAEWGRIPIDGRYQSNHPTD